MTKFFVERFLPSVVLLVLTATYLTVVFFGGSTSAALTTAMWFGGIASVMFCSKMTEWGARNRMANPVALWATALTSSAPLGPIIFLHVVPRSSLVFVSVFAIAFTVFAAAATAYLLERAIIGGQYKTWYIEYGYLPVGALIAASEEVGGHHLTSGLILGFFWFLHFFYKQIPTLLESVGVLPAREGG